MEDDELRLLEARWRLGEITVDDLHDVADRWLATGGESPALIRLFSLDPDELPWNDEEFQAAFEALLHERDAGSMSRSEAAKIVVLDMSLGLLEGRIAPDEAVWCVHEINERTGYAFDPLTEWDALKDEFSWNDSHPDYSRPRADIDADVIELARSIVKRHS